MRQGADRAPFKDRGNDLSQDRLKSLLVYDAESGVFRWRVDRSNKKCGQIAGYVNPTMGYVQIGVDYKLHSGHRLAWLYVNGRWPASQHLDHVNGDRADNRIDNLREASASQNIANSKLSKANKTGFKGVSLNRNRFVAQIMVGRKTIRLGSFSVLEDAYQTYSDASRRYFGEFGAPL